MEDLLTGLIAISQPLNLIALLAGVVIGISFAAIPGLQQVAAMSILLPFTYSMPPGMALVLMTAIYVTGVYGGSITAILYNIPGSPENVPTSFDGYPMTQKGQASKALGTAIICSALGGLFSAILLVFAAPMFVPVALTFGPVEYVALIFFALSMVALVGKSRIKSLLSALIGLFCATIGIGVVYGHKRFVFGTDYLLSGFDYIAVLVGVFAVGEVLSRTEREAFGRGTVLTENVSSVTATLPRPKEILALSGTILRASGLGFILGTLPALGSVIASFMGYEMERRIAGKREKFGTGIMRGVAAPEAANNASVGGAMIPFMTLGIPGSAATVIMLAVILLHGIQPGITLFEQQSELVYLVFVAVIVSNIFIVIGGLLAVPLFARMANVSFAYLGPAIILLCTIGAYTARNNLTDVWAMFGFGVLGYLMERHGFSAAVFVLGFILGPLLEASFLRSMLLHDDNVLVFFTKPLPAFLMVAGVLSMLVPMARVALTRFRER